MKIAYLPFDGFHIRPVGQRGVMDHSDPNLAEIFQVFTSPDPDIMSVIHIRRRARHDAEFRRDIGMLHATLKERGVESPSKIHLLFLELRFIRKRILNFEHMPEAIPVS
jgi:hypothetical protein